MKCPYCNTEQNKVVDKRDCANQAIRRRRECLQCSKRFTTHERVETVELYVIKKDQSRQKFDRNKLLAGMQRACEKRPVPLDTIHQIADAVESALKQRETTEVPSSLLGELVMEQLRKVDKVAYIRFASVYRDFQDLESFQVEVGKLLNQRW